MFFAQDPTIRWQTSGYSIWWIDRESDYGITLVRWDNGAITFLQEGTGDTILEPPLTWRVEVEGSWIRIFGDGTKYVEVEDETYREGFFGLWIYSNGQDVLYDDVRMGVTTIPECEPSGLQRPGVAAEPNEPGRQSIAE